MSEEQTPVEVVPPANRLGEILGWSLLVLAVACFVAFIVAAVQVYAASQAVQHADDVWFNLFVARSSREAAAYAAYKAAKAAYNDMTLRMFLLLDASLIFLLLIPGLLYAMKPSLLGGPLGRLVRPSSARLARRQPRRRHPVTFYQGMGVVLLSIATLSISLIDLVPIFVPTMSWLIILGFLMFIASYFVSLPLLVQATWWYTSRQRAGRGQERPQA